MLNPAIGKLISNCDSRYKLVLEIAKLARNISDRAKENGEIIIEKPVTIAMEDIASRIAD